MYMAEVMDDSQLQLLAQSAKHTSEHPVSTDTRGLRNAENLGIPVGTGRAAGGVATLPAERAGLRLRHGRYHAMVEELKSRYQIAIRKWRKHMSGVAYELKYRDGRIKRLITAPRPRSPVSAAIFLHEVGHHAIGFRRYKPRCLEEYYVWQWAFREMTTRNIPVDPRVLRHYRRSMFHYVRAAQKRGIRELPHELQQYMEWPG